MIHTILALPMQSPHATRARLIATTLASRLAAVAAILHRLSGVPTWLLYPLAGIAVMAVIRYLSSTLFYDMVLLVGTRGLLGILFLLLSGAVGGGVFTLRCRGFSPQSLQASR